MATSAALPESSDFNGVGSRSTHDTRTDPSASPWTVHIFVRKDCLEPAEGSAHFDDLIAHRSPPPMQSEPLPGQDCGPAGDDDVED